jgi:hypothetical protein
LNTLRRVNERSAKRPVAWDLAVAAMILVLAVGAGGAALWVGRHNTVPKKTPPTTFPLASTRVPMPDITGKNAYVAFTALGKVHLNLKVVSAVSRTAPGGTVMSQSPPAGTSVRSGSVVRLTVSRRP